MTNVTDDVRRCYARQHAGSQALRAALVTVMTARHEAGRALNRVYQDGPIPPGDLAGLAGINAKNYSAEQCSFMREFAKRASVKDIAGLVDEYGTWARICERYLVDTPTLEEAPA
jgi:hypothetical protein